MRTRESQEVMQSKVDTFNEKNPVGSSVTVVKDLGEKIERKIGAAAWRQHACGSLRLLAMVAHPAERRSVYETPHWDGHSQVRIVRSDRANRAGENPASTLFLS